MSARPGDWGLLGADGDPLPGDVYEVYAEARSYGDVATAIRDQIDRLRTMADGTDDLVGKFAPALREAAEDLASELAKTQGRFDTVAEQLSRWAPVLDDGRSTTWSLLLRAEEAHHRALSSQPSSGPPPSDPTPEQVAAERALATRHDEALADLGRLARQFHDEVSHVRSVARDVAGRIDAASDDKLKDSWWDSHVRKWIHDHASLLKVVADVLTFLATAIVIAVLLFTPVGWLALAAFIAVMAAGVGALLIHSALAANGDGSWVDVAIDVVAVATLGAGRLFAGGAEAARGTQLAVSAGEAGDAAFNATAVTGRLFVAGEDGISVTSRIVNVPEAVDAWAGAYQSVLSREITEVPLIERLVGGDSAALTADLRAMAAEFGETPLISRGLDASTMATRLYQIGATTDFTFKLLNDAFVGVPHLEYDGLRPWVHWKEEHTVIGLPEAWEKALSLRPAGLAR